MSTKNLGVDWSSDEFGMKIFSAIDCRKVTEMNFRDF